MTVETDLSRVQYATNGTTGPWSVPFYFLANADLRVVYTPLAGLDQDLVLTAEYSVSGAGSSTGGTITTVEAFPTGGTITVLRNVQAIQPTDYADTDAFPANTLERNLDRLTMLAQQSLEATERAVLLPVSFQGTSTLPGDAGRAGRLLGFDGSGNPGVSAFTQAQVAALLSGAEVGVSSVAQPPEVQTATAGQTVFTLATMSYTPGIGALRVFVNGLRLTAADFTETGASVVTFIAPTTGGEQVMFDASRAVSDGVESGQVSVTLTGTGTTGRSLHERSAESRAITDFSGADPTAVTDSSGAATSYKNWIEGNTIATVPAGVHPMRFPPGIYQLSAQSFSKAGKIIGAGSKSTFITLKAGETGSLFTFNAADAAGTSVDDTDHFSIEGVRLFGNRVDGTTTGSSHAINCPDAPFAIGTQYAPSVRVSDVVIEGFTGNGIFLGVNRNWALIDRVIARYCNDNGLASYSYDHRLVSSDFGVNKNVGVRLYAGGAIALTGCNLYFNTINMVVNNTVNAYVNAIGCAFDGALQQGLSVSGATGVVRAIGGRFSSNSRSGAGVYSDILVAGSACMVGVDGVDFTLGDQTVKHLIETTGTPTIMWGENEHVTSGSVPYATSVTNDWTLLRYAGAPDARIGSAGAGTLAAYTSGVERWKTSDANTTMNHPLLLPTYTVAGLPAAALHTRGAVYVSNESGGAVIAFSDGTNWRRVTDRAVVS